MLFRSDIDAGAFAVHGLSREFLSDKPLFANIVEELIEFVDGAEIVIHNAAFDLGFLDNEFALLKRPPFRGLAAKITDTLLDARQMFPGKRNSLDALCDRFSISNEHRTLHGALLDAQLLAEVYIAMTRGQEDLSIDLIDYTVNDPRSDTPYAVHHEGGWYYPDTYHSATSAQKQAITRRAIGVKSEREKTMERRAAKREAKNKAASEATEGKLWNS